MEKKKKHYPLERVKQLIAQGDWRVTSMALANAWADFNFLQVDIHDAVMRLDALDFYKSMTSHDDYSLWQDVYRPLLNGIMAYVKISIQNDHTVVVQFKRK